MADLTTTSEVGASGYLNYNSAGSSTIKNGTYLSTTGFLNYLGIGSPEHIKSSTYGNVTASGHYSYSISEPDEEETEENEDEVPIKEVISEIRFYIDGIPYNLAEEPTIYRNRLEEDDGGEAIVYTTDGKDFRIYSVVELKTLDGWERFLLQGDKSQKLSPELWEHNLELVEIKSYFKNVHLSDRSFSTLKGKNYTIKEVLNIYKKHLKYYQDIDITFNEDDENYDVQIPKKTYSGNNFLEIITDLMRRLDAIPRVDITQDGFYIYYDKYMDRGTPLTLDKYFNNLQVEHTNVEYGSAVVSKVKNAVQEMETMVHPNKNSGVTPRTESMTFTSSEAFYEIPYPIWKIEKVEMLDVPCRYAVGTSDLMELTEYITVDITSRVVQSDVRETKSVEALSNLASWEDVVEENLWHNTITYDVGENRIGGLVTPDGVKQFIFFDGDVLHLHNAIDSELKYTQEYLDMAEEDYYFRIDRDVTTTDEDFSKLKIRVKFVPQVDMDFETEKHDVTNKTPTQLTNLQGDSDIELGRYMQSMKGLVNRIGNDLLQYSRFYYYSEHIPKIGDYMGKYLLTNANYTYYPTGVMVLMEFTKNFNRLKSENAISNEQSPFTISSKTLLNNIRTKSYVEISTNNKEDTDRYITEFGKYAYNAMFTGGAIKTEVSDGTFQPHSDYLTEGDYLCYDEPEPRFHRNIITTGRGGMMTFYFSFQSPIIGGVVRDGGSTEGYKEARKQVLYTNFDGSLNTATITIGSDMLIDDDGSYPIVDKDPNNVSFRFEELPIDLDPEDRFALTHHVYTITDMPDNIIISENFSQNTPLIDFDLMVFEFYRSNQPYSIFDNKVRKGDTKFNNTLEWEDASFKLVEDYNYSEPNWCMADPDGNIMLAFNDIDVNSRFYLNFLEKRDYGSQFTTRFRGSDSTTIQTDTNIETVGYLSGMYGDDAEHVTSKGNTTAFGYINFNEFGDSEHIATQGSVQSSGFMAFMNDGGTTITSSTNLETFGYLEFMGKGSAEHIVNSPTINSFGYLNLAGVLSPIRSEGFTEATGYLSFMGGDDTTITSQSTISTTGYRQVTLNGDSEFITGNTNVEAFGYSPYYSEDGITFTSLSNITANGKLNYASGGSTSINATTNTMMFGVYQELYEAFGEAEFFAEGQVVDLSGNLQLVDTYVVTFRDYDGTVLHQETVWEGDDATPPTEPTREGYNFSGWDDDYTNITINKTIYATYEIIEYSVAFYDYDNTLIETQIVEHGSDASDPRDGWNGWTPDREGYTFEEWNKSLNNITETQAIVAQYTINSYTVDFFDYENNLLKTEFVDYKESATPPTAPERTGYDFVGWDGSYTNVTEDRQLYTEYEQKEYRVRFIDYDGTILKTEYVLHGQSATAPSDPSRTNYTFTGWSDSYRDITSNTDVTAQYEEHNQYYVHFYSEYTNTTLKTITVYETESVQSSDYPSIDENPTGYTFDGWDTPKEDAPFTVNSDTVIKAEYTINTHTVSLTSSGDAGDYYIDNQQINSKTVNYGEVVTIYIDLNRNYVFDNWSGTYSSNFNTYSFTMPDHNVSMEANTRYNLSGSSQHIVAQTYTSASISQDELQKRWYLVDSRDTDITVMYHIDEQDPCPTATYQEQYLTWREDPNDYDIGTVAYVLTTHPEENCESRYFEVRYEGDPPPREWVLTTDTNNDISSTYTVDGQLDPCPTSSYINDWLTNRRDPMGQNFGTICRVVVNHENAEVDCDDYYYKIKGT